MDLVIEILSQPFTWGLVVGLFFMVMVWNSMRKEVSLIKKECKRLEGEAKELQSHLSTQLKINATGNAELEKQLEEMREQNENLRVNLNGAMQKPGRAERRQYEVLELAVSRMREQAPGFAPAWEKALRDAEADHEAAEGGLKKLVRKVLPGKKVITDGGGATKSEAIEVAGDE